MIILLIVLMLIDACTGQLGVGNDEPVGVAKLAEDLTSKRFLQIACGGQHSVGLNGTPTWPARPTSFAHRALWALQQLCMKSHRRLHFAPHEHDRGCR